MSDNSLWATNPDPSRSTTTSHAPASARYGGTVDPATRAKCLRSDAKGLMTSLPEDHAIDFIKVDVEGAELLVFKGAARVLRQHRPMLKFECTLKGTKRFGWTPNTVHQFLVDQCGYNIFTIKDWFEEADPLDVDRFRSAMEFPRIAIDFLGVAQTNSTSETPAEHSDA